MASYPDIPLLVLGDFNNYLDLLLDNPITNRGATLSNFLAKLGLKDVWWGKRGQ